MKVNNEKGKFVAIGSILLNVVIFSVKIYLGLIIGSIALLSDSVHSISDSASSIAVYLGLKISEKPADEQHPHGHGRADIIAVLVVGIILIFTALAFLTEGVEAFLGRTHPLEDIPRHFYLYIILTAVAKEVMGEVSYFVGKKTGSDSLKADAWHHRGDAITTILVVGAIYGSELGIWFLDPLAGIGIAILLGYIGVSYVKKSTDRLLGTKPSKDLIDNIKKVSTDVDGVKDVHNIQVHDYGSDKSISLHMKSNKGTIRSAHMVSHKLEKKLKEKFGSTAEIHLDPVSIPREKISELVEDISNEYDNILEIHKLEIAENTEKILISFHLIVPEELTIKESHEMATEFEKELLNKATSKFDANVEVRAHIEPEDEKYR